MGIAWLVVLGLVKERSLVGCDVYWLCIEIKLRFHITLINIDIGMKYILFSPGGNYCSLPNEGVFHQTRGGGSE